MNLIAPIVGYSAEMAQIRRTIHAHPELCYEEVMTAELVAQQLASWGIPMLRGLAKTGVIGIIKKGSSARAIGLRADMDALPMQELNTFAHASKHAGKMHACGHDGHTAMLLTAARYLQQEAQFDGTVYLIFQPAEEGGGGAREMIAEGLFEKCPMDAVYGMHNWPGIAVGAFGVTPGPMMASSNEFDLTIRGKGGHAALPHKSVDPVMCAVQIAQAWQTIITRNKNPLDTAVISLTQINAGTTTNVIPDDARMQGTVRAFRNEVLDLIEKRMGDIAQHIGAAFDVEIDFRFRRNYPPVINHEKETAFAVQILQGLVGAANVDARTEPSMGAEDFAYFLQHKPGCYVFIGNGEGSHRDAGHGLGPCNLHNASYDFNDALLPIGASFWVRLTEAALAPEAA
ncbi:M20 aminoacylase family protein [Massilia sp. W12]|uniref:M20 aminoacylase family protein n=1 Tax=Massilia sp. W12 TaxID=3126507 RepID=UPI0030D457D1